ncbi:MAG: SsrA-binding protein SmpB [Candidatus Sumerlaeia bacterium]
MTAKTSPSSSMRVVATNRRARHDYHLLDTFEAGIVLHGSEVKSLRAGRCSLVDSYAQARGGELWLENMFIPPYERASAWRPHERRARKLLLHKDQIRRLIGATTRKGFTIIPTRVYFNDKNIAKVEIALAQGKKSHDKREAIRERDLKRSGEREFRKR